MNLIDDHFVQFMNSHQGVADIDNPSFLNKLVSYCDQQWKNHNYFQIEQSWLDQLTLAQLEKLGSMHERVKDCKTYIGSVFQKKFHFELDPENKDSFSLLETRDHLKRMYEESTSMPQSFKS